MENTSELASLAQGHVRNLRKKLLDTSKRNRLVSFKHSDRARTHIRVIDELPDVLFDRLTDGKSLTFKSLPELTGEPEDEQTNAFLSALEAARASDEAFIAAMAEIDDDETAPQAQKIERELKDRVRKTVGLPPRTGKETPSLSEHARRHGFEPSYDLPEPDADDEDADKHLDNEIQTLLVPEAMSRKLSAIRDQYRSSLQETGINTLYCVFGFLEWRETDNSTTSLMAPLLLLSVDIERKLHYSRYRYTVSASGEDIQVNLSLSERLYQDFKFRLPEFADEDSPETYFERVREQVCRHKAGWKVRRFVTFGHFSFARLVMYHDLGEEVWTAPPLPKNPIIQELLTGANSDSAMFAEDYDIDTPEIAKLVPVLISDADASQHSAVVDAVNGKNLVIEGPPGTGKSQTITNIIAAALSKGKRVLFVAEKMAALDVVKSRLDKAGLGDYCLELHSNKAKKKEILESLHRRLACSGKVPEPDHFLDKIKELEAYKAKLRAYADLINSRWGGFGKTLHDILWTYRRFQDKDIEGKAALDQLRIPNAEKLTESNFISQLALLEDLEAAASRLQHGIQEHPWRCVPHPHLSPFEQESILGGMRDCVHAIEDILSSRDRLHDQSGIALPDTMPIMMGEVDFLSQADLGPDNLAEVRPLLADPALRHTTRDWISASQALHQARERLTVLGIAPTSTTEYHSLCSLLADAIKTSRDLEIASAYIESLPEIAAHLCTEAQNLRQAIEWIGRVVQLLSIGKITATSCRAAALAIEMASSADPQILPMLTADILHPDSHDILASAAERCSALREQKTSVDAKFTRPPGLDSLTIRRHASALRDAGVFSFLSSSVRDAKAFFRQIAKVPKAEKTVMVQSLTELAEHMDAVAEFLADEQVRAIMGRHFRGLDTAFEKALAACTWGKTVRHTLTVEEEFLSARKALLRGDADILEALRAFGTDPHFTATRFIFTRMPLPKGDLSPFVRKWDEQATALNALHRSLIDAGVPGTISLDDLPTILEHLQTVQDQTARYAKALTSLPEEHRPLIESAGAFAMEKMLHAVEHIQKAGMSAPVTALLLATDAEQRLANAHPLLQCLKTEIERLSTHLRNLEGLIDITAFIADGDPLHVPHKKIEACLEHADQLPAWADWLSSRQTVEDAGLADFLTLWENKTVTHDLPEAYRRVFYRALAERAFATHPDLKSFSGLDLQQTKDRFRKLDRKILRHQSQALAATLCRRPITAGNGRGKKSSYTQKALILTEIGKQKKHIPIRDLLDRAGKAIQEMKPCFMMSPISVAQYLKPNGLRFDLVVIDEASQMRPEDALGAIARASQIVVVGDPKQLPPSSFFDRLEESMDDEEDEEERPDNESILDLALSVFRPARRLNWHYRSRHGGLVAFSNKEFYDDSLIVFPSPHHDDPNYGVSYVPVAGLYKGQTNLSEVTAITHAAQQHMHLHPDRSLGLVALNQKQRELISDEMDRICSQDPICEAYRSKWESGLESFFVKNLENVQGDERDTIFISTVYGPDESGQVLNRFGPINGVYGHRRLNVLFTRAKQQVQLFTSLKPENIRLSETSSRGLSALQGYLQYAMTGQLETGTPTGHDADSDFEIWVRKRLQDKGYQVDAQVGVAGYRLDLAVRHPDFPGTYLLGVECDGATYHHTRSARDRDRLRQDVLEGLGWRIYRIWSTDWFKQPENELKRLIEAIEAYRNEIRYPTAAPTPPEPASPQPERIEFIVPSQEPVVASVPLGRPQKEALTTKKTSVPSPGQKVRAIYADGSSAIVEYLGKGPGGHLKVRLGNGAYEHFMPNAVTIQPLSPESPATTTRPRSDELPLDIPSPRSEDTASSIDLVRRKLITLREQVILKEFPDSDRSKGLLRDNMLRSLLKHLPQDKAEFLAEIPKPLREVTDSRQMKYLDQIFDILAEIEE